MTDYRPGRIFSVLLLALAFSGCATVSFDEPKPYSKVITDTPLLESSASSGGAGYAPVSR